MIDKFIQTKCKRSNTNIRLSVLTQAVSKWIGEPVKQSDVLEKLRGHFFVESGWVLNCTVPETQKEMVSS